MKHGAVILKAHLSERLECSGASQNCQNTCEFCQVLSVRRVACEHGDASFHWIPNLNKCSHTFTIIGDSCDVL